MTCIAFCYVRPQTFAHCGMFFMWLEITTRLGKEVWTFHMQYGIYRLSAKRCANGGSDVWLSIKSIWNTLSCCCFVCAFIIGQYHSGNNMSSKSEAAGEILFFESEKHQEIWPLKTDTLTVSSFNAFVHVHDESKHYLSHRFAQRRYCFTQFI